MTTPQTSREIARLSATPLAKIYIEVQSPYWAKFTDDYLKNDDPKDDYVWLVEALKASQKISQEKQTDDEDLILAELLNGDYAAQIKKHLKEAPDGWLYEKFHDE